MEAMQTGTVSAKCYALNLHWPLSTSRLLVLVQLGKCFLGYF